MIIRYNDKIAVCDESGNVLWGQYKGIADHTDEIPDYKNEWIRILFPFSSVIDIVEREKVFALQSIECV